MILHNEHERRKTRPGRARLGGTYDSPVRVICSTDARSNGTRIGMLNGASHETSAQMTCTPLSSVLWGEGLGVREELG